MKEFIVAMVLCASCALSACGGDAHTSVTSAASDSQVNGCAELSGVAEFAMRNRQNGVALETQIRATRSASESAVVRSVYQLPISTSPSNAWGITQTACLKVLK